MQSCGDTGYHRYINNLLQDLSSCTTSFLGNGPFTAIHASNTGASLNAKENFDPTFENTTKSYTSSSCAYNTCLTVQVYRPFLNNQDLCKRCNHVKNNKWMPGTEDPTKGNYSIQTHNLSGSAFVLSNVCLGLEGGSTLDLGSVLLCSLFHVCQRLRSTASLGCPFKTLVLLERVFSPVLAPPHSRRHTWHMKQSQNNIMLTSGLAPCQHVSNSLPLSTR